MKLGGRLTVNAMDVAAVRVPAVPLILIVAVPTAAVGEAVKVTTLVPVAGFVPKVAVTPVGSPVDASVTGPLKPLAAVTVTVAIPDAPWTKVSDGADEASVKLGAALTVSAIEVDALRVPEVALMMMVDVPSVAVPLAVNVRTLEPVAGLVAKAAVTPLGKPVADRVTLPVKPPNATTEIVLLPVLP